MANKCINAVENPVSECCFDILHIPVTSSRGKKEFISTCISSDRVFITNSQQLVHQLDPDSKDVKLKSNIDRYVMQPTILEKKWCLADLCCKN